MGSPYAQPDGPEPKHNSRAKLFQREPAGGVSKPTGAMYLKGVPGPT